MIYSFFQEQLKGLKRLYRHFLSEEQGVLQKKLYICIQIKKKEQEMKLIAESGSTRTEWALVEDNRLVQRVFTEGLILFFRPEEK